ncbi:MAG: hypothetical protein LBL87_06805 [Ruminococcus sp.]|jgi:hypothetical protein|nr:hypothetical protein [Ruminococcus sp.]
MAVQQKSKKSHKTDALMRLLVSGSSGAVNPSVSVTFKEDIIRPINDKKHAPKAAAEPVLPAPEKFSEKPTEKTAPPRIMPPAMPKPAVSAPAALTPPAFATAALASETALPIRPEIPAPRINPDNPTQLDIVTELTKELLPTAIQRFNVCYCDTCYQAMTEAVAKRSPKIVVMVRSKDDLARAEYLKRQNRNNVLRTVIKEVLEYKTTGRHNNNGIRK